MEQLDGPIPGENFTRDTKNYAWHRPPEFTDLDKATEMIGKKLMSETSAPGLLTMMESGVTIADLAQIFLMSAVGAGKFTLDFAILLAGPTAHIMYLMAKSYGIECDLGIETKSLPKSKAYFEGAKEVIDGRKVNAVDTDKAPPVPSSGGLGKPQTSGGY
jgi:hypothetical protein